LGVDRLFWEEFLTAKAKKVKKVELISKITSGFLFNFNVRHFKEGVQRVVLNGRFLMRLLRLCGEFLFVG
jgi:hypothetical protein